MDKQDGKIYDVDFSSTNDVKKDTEESDNMGNGSAATVAKSRANLDLGFDYEVETMFNPSDKPQTKAEFLASLDEGNEMYPYSEALTYCPKAEQHYNERIDAYFQDCRRKIKEAEELERGRK